MTETAWWALIVFLTNALVFAVTADVYRRRVFALRRRHALEIAEAQQLATDANVRVRNVELKERLYGRLPYVEIERNIYE